MAEVKKLQNISTVKGLLIIGGYALFLVISISILSSKLGIFNKTDYNHEKISITKIKMTMIAGLINKFCSDCGRYPDDSEGLDALLDPPSDLEAVWKGPYLKKSGTLDGWGNFYIYLRNDKKSVGYDIVSYGADGIPGGKGYNADIYNE